MHKTFYIEVDEEISSVIDKLHKSSAEENYFVVTKRAMVLQSIVNLKLLKREADKLKKNIILVTADEKMAKMAERAGISTQSSMEGLEFSETDHSDNKEEKIDVEVTDFSIKSDKKSFVNVGSDEYSEGLEKSNSDYMGDTEKEVDSEKKIEVTVSTPSAKKKTIRTMTDLKRRTGSEAQAISSRIKKPVKNIPQQPTRITRKENYDIKESFETFLDPQKEEKIGKIFNNCQGAALSPKKIEEKGNGNGNFIFTLLLLGMIFLAGAVAYVFVPNAEVVAYLDSEKKDLVLDVEIDGNLQVSDVDGLKITANVVEKESEIVFSGEATGVSETSGQKSKGNLVVYNEYSNSEQPLVATTRFETEDGKIFRLVKGVVVPGLSVLGGKSVPGAIEVEVVADAPGDSFNIDATSFTIPGFKGTDKYKKIYAKSTKPMLGGGISEGVVKIVSQEDIDAAKKKSEDLIKEKIIGMMEAELKENEMLVRQSFEMEVIDSTPYAKSGDLKNSFDYQIKVKAKAFAVLKENVDKIVFATYSRENKKTYEYEVEDISVDFQSAKSDFENNKAELKIAATIFAKPIFDGVGFKENLTSKVESEIRDIMKGYPQVKNLEINVNPSFISKMPKFENRITLEIRDFKQE